MKPAVVFSHANGFPAGTYRILLDHLRGSGWRVLAIPKFGHDARFPVTSNWPHLRDQLVQFIEAQSIGPAYLVGHSLGGYLSLLAAARRPELAAGVVLLDSPLLPDWMGRVVQFGKTFGVGERFSPAAVSKRRRQHWPSAEAAFAHFAAKPVFARWADGVLADYLACGLEAGSQGVHLSFQRDVETRIYNTLPHHLPRLLRTHPLRCPAAFIGAHDSQEMRRVGLRATRRVVHNRVTMLAGSHLFPMEAPLEAASAIDRWLSSFESQRGAPGPLATPRL